MSYSITQVVNGTSITQTTVTTTVSAISYPANYQGDKIQQLVFSLPESSNTCYWVRLEIPQNQSYDLNYGIRLLKNSANDSSAWTNVPLRDISDYQFIKYISVPKHSDNNIDYSTVWLYREKNDTLVNAAVAKVDNSLTPGSSVAATDRANRFYYNFNNDNHIIYYYDDNGNAINRGSVASPSYNFYNYIDYYPTILPHNFTENTESLSVNEFLIIPSDSSYRWVYLYLKPIDDDRNLMWVDETNNVTMMGRHIENIDDIKVTYKALTNSDNIVSNLGKVTNIGIWGRPGQLMAINDQELKIGPSGYYELKDYQINSLYVINSASTDKYTVDIQYETQEVLNG